MGFIYSTSVIGWTPINHADGASPANSSYHSVRNAAVTDVAAVTELFISGDAIATVVNRMALRRNSTNSTTPTNVAPGLFGPGAPASSQQQFVLTGTPAVLASTTHLGTWSMNCFGGLIRAAITPGQEPSLVGTAAPNAEFTLDSVNGVGVVTTNILFEAR